MLVSQLSSVKKLAQINGCGTVGTHTAQTDREIAIPEISLIDCSQCLLNVLQPSCVHIPLQLFSLHTHTMYNKIT